MKWLVFLSALAAAQAATFSNGTSSSDGGQANGTGTGMAKGTGHATGTGKVGPTGTGASTSTKASSTARASATPTGKAITAHPDGQCLKPLNATSNFTTLVPSMGFPNYTTFKNPTFPGAESSTGGYDVWFNVPQPDAGCRYQLMLPYAETYGTPGLPGGNEIMNVGTAGCYFSKIPVSTNLMLSFCCGSGDCTTASLNSTVLLTAPDKANKREEETLFSAEAEVDARNAAAATADEGTADLVPRQGGGSLRVGSSAQSQSSRVTRDEPSKVELAERFIYSGAQYEPCDYKAGQPFSQAGPQVIVTSGQSCPASLCPIAVNHGVSFSTTATSSTTQTLTNTVGASITFSMGVDFLGLDDGRVDASLMWQFSAAVAKETGQSIMTGNSTTIMNELSLQLGNNGAVTFTPTYRCWTGPMNCGKGDSDPITSCQPDFENGILKGDYNVIVYDS